MVNTYKEYTDEQMERAEKILSDRKINDNPLCTFYVTLGQTHGSKNVRFVLYKLLHKVISPYVNPFTFQGILSDNLIDACEKAKTMCGKNPIVIEFDNQKLRQENMKPNFLPFGKYKDIHIEDVLQSDPNYIFWLANNYNGRNSGLIHRLTELRKIAKDFISYENSKKFKSDFIGVVGQKITVQGIIQSVYSCNFGGVTLKIMDSNGNFFTKSGSIKIFQKGDSIQIEGKIKSHYESMGIKYTSFGGRCKITLIS